MRNTVIALLFTLAVVAGCQTEDPDTTYDIAPVVAEPETVDSGPLLLSESGQTIGQAARVFYDGLSDSDMEAVCFNLGVPGESDPDGFLLWAYDGRDEITFGPGESFPNDEQHRAELADYLETVQDACAE